MAITARQWKIGIAAIGAISAATIGGFLIGVIPRYLSPTWGGVLATTVLIGAFLASLPRWHRLDHMQRDSRLVGWYWGGGFGGGLGLVLTLVFAGVRSPFFAGAALIWLLQFTGYALARLQWWLAHRSKAG